MHTNGSRRGACWQINSNSNLNGHFKRGKREFILHVSHCVHICLSVNPSLRALCVLISLLDCIFFPSRDSRSAYAMQT